MSLLAHLSSSPRLFWIKALSSSATISPPFGVTCKLEDQALHCLLQMFNGTSPITSPCGVVPRVQYNPFITLPGAPSTGLVSFWWWAASSSAVVSQMAEEREEVAFPAPLAPTLLIEGSAGCCTATRHLGLSLGCPGNGPHGCPLSMGTRAPFVHRLVLSARYKC